MPTRIGIEYDALTDTLTIEGVKYSGELFRQFAQAMPIGTPFRIVKRENGEVTVERLYDATCPMCGTSLRSPISKTKQVLGSSARCRLTEWRLLCGR